MKNLKIDASKSLTPQEVADNLIIAKNTVYALIKRGELRAYKVGNKMRIEASEVEDYKKRMSSGLSPEFVVAETASFAPGSNPHKGLASTEIGGSSPLVIFGQDIALDVLSKHIEAKLNISPLRSYVGSYSGIYALYNGSHSLATAHLYDADSNSYNTEYVKRMLPGTPVVVINFLKRMQGFYVKEGNPKNITGWEDLNRKDLVIANREKGSGTRVLLDEKLRKMKKLGSSLNGYNTEYDSHLAVASAVFRDLADFGLGNEIAARTVKGVEFIPLQTESYDIIIKYEEFIKPFFQGILEILNSAELKDELSGVGSYDTSQIGTIKYITPEFV